MLSFINLQLTRVRECLDPCRQLKCLGTIKQAGANPRESQFHLSEVLSDRILTENSHKRKAIVTDTHLSTLLLPTVINSSTPEGNLSGSSA